MRTFLPILLFVLLSFLVGFISMLVQHDAMLSWYPFLEKPLLTPPGMVFSVVWSILYLLMGISAGLVWDTKAMYSWMLELLFTVQLALNLLWSICFFHMQSPVLGFAVLVVLFMFVVLYVAGCYVKNRWAAFINIPYMLWLVFAGYLNLYIIMNN